MKLKAALVLAALAAGASGAAAHSNDARQAEQADWIEAGRDAGTITWNEGRKLRREQRIISRIEDRMKADGRLSRDERRTLHRLQDTAQSHIARENNDRWKRLWWLPRVGR